MGLQFLANLARRPLPQPLPQCFEARLLTINVLVRNPHQGVSRAPQLLASIAIVQPRRVGDLLRRGLQHAVLLLLYLLP